MDITKIILLYLCIAIACVFWQPEIVLGDSKQAETVLGAFNIDLTNYETLNNFGTSNLYNNSVNNIFEKGTEAQGQNIFLTIVDGLFNVIGYINLLFRAVFSPVIIMVAGSFPIQIMYILGIPMIILFIIATIRFIRGY